MRPEDLYDALAFPAEAALGKRVFKKQLVDHGELNSADKRALTDTVDAIVWQYTLKPATVPVQRYRDDDHEYDEIAVLELQLSDRRFAARLAEVVHRTIPYPVLLVSADADGSQLSAAPKRRSRVRKDAIVAGDVEMTPWLDDTERVPEHVAFLRSLRFAGLPHTDFKALHDAWVDRILALRVAALNGTFDVPATTGYEIRRAALEKCLALDREIRATRAAIRAETSFARQFALNTELHEKRTQLKRALGAL